METTKRHFTSHEIWLIAEEVRRGRILDETLRADAEKAAREHNMTGNNRDLLLDFLRL